MEDMWDPVQREKQFRGASQERGEEDSGLKRVHEKQG